MKNWFYSRKKVEKLIQKAQEEAIRGKVYQFISTVVNKELATFKDTNSIYNKFIAELDRGQFKFYSSIEDRLENIVHKVAKSHIHDVCENHLDLIARKAIAEKGCKIHNDVMDLVESPEHLKKLVEAINEYQLK